jgi:hypothetical protein
MEWTELAELQWELKDLEGLRQTLQLHRDRDPPSSLPPPRSMHIAHPARRHPRALAGFSARLGDEPGMRAAIAAATDPAWEAAAGEGLVNSNRSLLSAELAKAGRHEEAISFIDRVSTPLHRNMAAISAAREALEAGQRDSFDRLAAHAAQIDPGDDDARLEFKKRLLQLYLHAGDRARASAMVESASDYSKPLLLAMSAEDYLSRGQKAEAVSHAKLASKAAAMTVASARQIDSPLRIGRVLARVGDETAIRQFLAAVMAAKSGRFAKDADPDGPLRAKRSRGEGGVMQASGAERLVMAAYAGLAEGYASVANLAAARKYLKLAEDLARALRPRGSLSGGWYFTHYIPVIRGMQEGGQFEAAADLASSVPVEELDQFAENFRNETAVALARAGRVEEAHKLKLTSHGQGELREAIISYHVREGRLDPLLAWISGLDNPHVRYQAYVQAGMLLRERSAAPATAQAPRKAG